MFMYLNDHLQLRLLLSAILILHTLVSKFSLQNVSFIESWQEAMMAGDFDKNIYIDSKEDQSCQAYQREGVDSLELQKVCRS